jgi:hypothetical protein
VQETGSSGLKMALGFIAVAVPLLSIAAYAGSVIARPPTAVKKLAVDKTPVDAMTTGSVAAKKKKCPALPASWIFASVLRNLISRLRLAPRRAQQKSLHPRAHFSPEIW